MLEVWQSFMGGRSWRRLRIQDDKSLSTPKTRRRFAMFIATDGEQANVLYRKTPPAPSPSSPSSSSPSPSLAPPSFPPSASRRRPSR